MGTKLEQSDRDWKLIESLPVEERPFRFRWADGAETEMAGFDPVMWGEDGHRPEPLIEWQDL
ncbi:hypothetical protein ACFQRC_07320 [Enterovirga sp. GCM10030262]|uniref:hypothetical protein n=1 Tax=Enterovirga sp. GCM10030262 TaxID=3273391 RepID=UPI003622D3AB